MGRRPRPPTAPRPGHRPLRFSPPSASPGRGSPSTSWRRARRPGRPLPQLIGERGRFAARTAAQHRVGTGVAGWDAGTDLTSKMWYRPMVHERPWKVPPKLFTRSGDDRMIRSNRSRWMLSLQAGCRRSSPQMVPLTPSPSRPGTSAGLLASSPDRAIFLYASSFNTTKRSGRFASTTTLRSPKSRPLSIRIFPLSETVPISCRCRSVHPVEITSLGKPAG